MSEQTENAIYYDTQPTELIKNEIKRFQITVKDIAYVIALILSSILVSAIGVFGGFRGGFTASAIILTVIMTLFLVGKGYKFKLFPIICLVLSLGVSLSFLITSNAAVRFFSFVLFYCLNIVWFTSIVRNETERGDLGFFKFIFSPLIETIENMPAVFVSIFSSDKKSNKTVGKVFIGLILAIPVLLVVIPLLVSSDAAFSGMIMLLFKKTVTIISRILLGLLIGVFIVSYSLTLKKSERPVRKKATFMGLEPIVIISFLSVLTVCYLSYLFSQLAYFFDAFGGFLPNGYEFTVATYARRGFFEMTVIAAINLFVIFICRFFARGQQSKAMAALNALCTFIGVFTLIIIATALSKMFLYIGSYGMTKLRITTSMFMLFLAVVFIALLIRLYTRKVNVLKTAFVTAAVALILLGVFNVNGVVAKYNYTAYKSGALKEIDVQTIAELGDEGIPYLVKLAEEDNDELSLYAAYKLSLAYEDYYDLDYNSEFNNYKIKGKTYTELGQMCISRQKAYNELESYLKEHKYILEYKDEYGYVPEEEW